MTRRALFLSAGLTLAEILIIFLWLPVRYEINDDVVFKNILSGQDGFPPDSSSTTHCLSQTLSSVLFHLYRWFPPVPWYQMTLYAASAVGVFLMLSVLVRCALEKGSLLYVALVLPASVVYTTYLFSTITYTSSALVLEFGVFLSLFDWVRRDRVPSRPQWRQAVFLTACLAVSFLIRWETVLYLTVFGVPLLIFMKRDHLKPVVLMIAAFMLFIAGDRVLFALTASQAQKEFVQFDAVRKAFHDTAAGEYWGQRTVDAAREVGWNINDYWFFRTWAAYDDRLFSVAKVQEFLKDNYDMSVGLSPSAIWSRWKVSIKNNWYYLSIFALTVLSLLAYNGRGFLCIPARQKRKTLIAAGMICGGMVLLMYYRFPLRISVPLLFFAVSALFALLDDHVTHRSSQGIILSIVLLSLTTWQGYAQMHRHYRYLASSEQENEYISKCLERIERGQERPVLIVPLLPAFSYGIGLEKVSPVDSTTDFTRFVDIFANPLNSPRYFSYLRRQGLKDGHDFMRWMINNPDVLLVFFDRGIGSLNTVIPLWQSYYERNITMGIAMQLQTVYDFRNPKGMGLVFFRIITA